VVVKVWAATGMIAAELAVLLWQVGEHAWRALAVYPGY